jgi:hypothetical protein
MSLAFWDKGPQSIAIEHLAMYVQEEREHGWFAGFWSALVFVALMSILVTVVS